MDDLANLASYTSASANGPLITTQAGSIDRSNAARVEAGASDIDLVRVAVTEASQDLFAQTLDDDPEFERATVSMLEYVGANPRRCKKFINAFGLQAMIANRRGLLDRHVVELRTLAGWTALSLTWPELFDALAADTGLIGRLLHAQTLRQQVDGIDGDEPPRPQLRKLLSERVIRRYVDVGRATPLLELLALAPGQLKSYAHLAEVVGASVTVQPAVGASPTVTLPVRSGLLQT